MCPSIWNVALLHFLKSFPGKVAGLGAAAAFAAIGCFGTLPVCLAISDFLESLIFIHSKLDIHLSPFNSLKPLLIIRNFLIYLKPAIIMSFCLEKLRAAEELIVVEVIDKHLINYSLSLFISLFTWHQKIKCFFLYVYERLQRLREDPSFVTSFGDGRW